MASDLSSFQNLYNDVYGALLYLLPMKMRIEEQAPYDQWKETQETLETLKKLANCPLHNEIRRFVCLEQTCTQRGLICSLCLVESHKMHSPKLFKIEEVAHFLQENEKVLRETEEDDGKMLKEILEDDTLPTFLEDFSSNLTKYYIEFLEKVQTKNHDKVEFLFDKGDLKNGEEVLSQRLDLIGSLALYDEKLAFQRMTRLKESKEKIVQKIDFFKRYFIKEMEKFEDKMKAVIHVTLNLKTDMSFEKYEEVIENKKPEIEFEEPKNDEQQDMEEENQQPMLLKSGRPFSMEQNIIRRLPHLPLRTESYWPVTCYKKERIKFTPLRERVQLLGFTQLKIMNFENQVAKFKITLHETKTEPQDLEPKMIRIASSKERKPENTVLTQNFQIKPEPRENEESNLILFDDPVLLKEGHEYVLELAAVKNYGFTCKYGLNNQSQCENGILKFLPARDEFEFCKGNSYGEFVTNETQGLFPSLIYDIVLKNSSIFEFPSC